ncbi:PAS domain-containing protein [Streptomyces sudanensis]|uniref:PAS domain-containing protein n=1 Tax=Streptomyces sudanensis TaxID=436397 RepID=UPI0020CB9419|nr:PAS domain-containing protein [Streptomyces sudanensis]MCP9958509.1 PAS domain-containing protein [Streptomyces sudanensis]MCP9987627.1 PAS domain-containing protein [Streptomyces sudanensis]
MSASRSGTARMDGDLLSALLDGMDAALCAFDADGAVTHWNGGAERLLGWSAAEAVGRRGLAGWAARPADAAAIEARLAAAGDGPDRAVHEFPLLRKDGGRVLVRAQTSAVRGADGRPAGAYCAFGEVHEQLDFERSLALGEALFGEAPCGLVVVDADLRPAVVNARASQAFGVPRADLLGRPLAGFLAQGAEQLEAALEHVLAEGDPRASAELWTTVRTARGERRHCWRSAFLRLASPLSREPAPLGVAWLFEDVTEARLAGQDADRLRFRASQLHRAGTAAAECEDPAEAATVYLDFALAGFADDALLDVVGGDGARLVRVAATPVRAPGPVAFAPGAGFPVPYAPGHPALRALDRAGTVRASTRPSGAASAWPAERHWPAGAAHALCAALRSRGRTLGVVTFLRSESRPPFERQDVAYAESVAVRVAASLDLAGPAV